MTTNVKSNNLEHSPVNKSKITSKTKTLSKEILCTIFTDNFIYLLIRDRGERESPISNTDILPLLQGQTNENMHL